MDKIKSWTKKEYTDHLAHNHKVSPFVHYIREIVYGANEGILTTFAVVAGFSGASMGSEIPTYSILTVLLFGLANLFADGTAMGLGNFLSVRANQKVYRKEWVKEELELTSFPKLEKGETKLLLVEKGFSDIDAETMTNIFEKNPNYWSDFMMEGELKMSNPQSENPVLNAIVTFFAFVTFGFIPLIPYLLIPSVNDAFIASCGSSFFALVLLGFLRGRATNEKLINVISEVVLVGGASSIVAFTVGSFFRI